MLTPALNVVSSLGKLPALRFCNDDLIYLSYTLYPPKDRQFWLLLIAYCTDIKKLHADAAKLNWMSVTTATNVNNKVRNYI